ncbi:hypothetical protein TNCT_609611 [Trichonephila clavata]|uniref:Uncharacterized protein n=1 Tax=Trichonephila clavata TaxID=2740835 RepID=A0A8X6GDV1_TRICU|nr:hypothetical protein TNCT_609611 [Trichonephila clavata]
MSLKKKPSGAEFREREGENQQKELQKVSREQIFLSNRESTEIVLSDSQAYSSGGRENWNENNNYGLPSTSQTQSVTDSDIAMPIRCTLLENGFELEDPGTWNKKDMYRYPKYLTQDLEANFLNSEHCYEGIKIKSKLSTK